MSNTPEYMTYIPAEITKKGLRKLALICTFITRFNAMVVKCPVSHSLENEYVYILKVTPWENDEFYNKMDYDDFAYLVIEELNHRLMKAL